MLRETAALLTLGKPGIDTQAATRTAPSGPATSDLMTRTLPTRLFCLLALATPIALQAAAAAPAPRQIERLDRGVVAIRSGDGVFVGWRQLATDPAGLA